MSTILTFNQWANNFTDCSHAIIMHAIENLPADIRAGSGADHFRKAVIESGNEEYLAALEQRQFALANPKPLVPRAKTEIEKLAASMAIPYRHMSRNIEDVSRKDILEAIQQLPAIITPGSKFDEFAEAVRICGDQQYIAALEAKFAEADYPRRAPLSNESLDNLLLDNI
jgi:hypothetical protein